MNLDTSVGNLDVADAEYVAIIVSVTVYGSITAIGLTAVTVFLAVQIKGRSTFNEFPFFSIVWYLTLINLLNLITQATCIFPCMLVEIPDTGPLAVWQQVGVCLNDFTDQAIMYLTLLMAINRFAVFVWKDLQAVFSTYHIRKVIWLTILIVIPLTTYRQIFGTRKKYNKKTLNFDDVLLTQSSDILINIISVSLYTLPLANLIIYVIIYGFIRKQRRHSMYQSNDNDIALLYQAITVSFFLELTRAFSVSAPMLKTDTWVQWVLNITRSVCSVCNHSINPILFMTTNKTVQRVLKGMLPRIYGVLQQSTSDNSGIPEKGDPTPPTPSPGHIVMTL
ncbi:unnamed protein product, partial [Mesorhabditis spiculigera]